MQRISLVVGMRMTTLWMLLWARSVVADASALHAFTSCLHTARIQNFTTQSTPTTYDRLLLSSIRNLRFTTAATPKPSALIFPRSKLDVQNAIKCCTQNGWELRIRNGGHSYEGLSFTADAPFVVIDLMNMDSVIVDLNSKTAWVEGGATLGQIYYAISQTTSHYGFPAGTCPTVGCGGHISGGGFGILSRMYGLASDNILDAQMVDAAGILLDRNTMGEDVFWALTGGGGGNWGVVVAWKIRLVPVPPIVTVFSTTKTGMKDVTNLVHKWQAVAAIAPPELYMSVIISGVNQTQKHTYHSRMKSTFTTDISASFEGQYLGTLHKALSAVRSAFPDLGLRTHHCTEMSWIQSVFYFSGLPSDVPLAGLADRFRRDDDSCFKAKSDYVTTPLPKHALEEAFLFLEESPTSYVIFDPYGGKMAQIPSNATAFPHRNGTFYGIQYQVTWNEGEKENPFLAWLQRLYDFMAPYVSQNPRRAAYVNYVDLDLGVAKNGTATVAQARTWGESYFQGNFERLVAVKTKIDPHNVFRHAQSIPPASV